MGLLMRLLRTAGCFLLGADFILFPFKEGFFDVPAKRWDLAEWDLGVNLRYSFRAFFTQLFTVFDPTLPQKRPLRSCFLSRPKRRVHVPSG